MSHRLPRSQAKSLIFGFPSIFHLSPFWPPTLNLGRITYFEMLSINNF